MHNHRLMTASLLALALLVAVILYWPGLSGTFLLDDQANLAKLQKISTPLTWEQLMIFSASNPSGPLGRPLSMWSFGLQYAAWPADPAAFKLANLAIHLANACLVFWLVLVLGKSAGWKNRTSLFACMVATLWVVHPIQVSTTLYVIQRMTLLAGFFTLAGLIAFVIGRQLVDKGQTTKGLMVASGGLILGTALAIGCKESGVLLPLYALAIESTLFANKSANTGWAKWRAIFLYAPLVLGIIYFLLHFGQYVRYEGRDFTLGERLLTEPRVVMDYLRKILLLPPYSFGVFFDDYTISRSLTSPLTTLWSMAAVLSLLVSAFWARARFPVYGFAVLWFLLGHALESTVIPLELYFEHRNYLPSVGIVLGVSFYASEFIQQRPKQLQLAYGAIGGLVFVAMIGLTWQQTRLWGNPLLQAALWAKEKPTSQRALQRAGTLFALAGSAEMANRHFSALGQRFPDKADGVVLQFYLACLFPGPSNIDMQNAINRVSTSKRSGGTLSALGELVRLKEMHQCENVPNDGLHALLDTAASNPNFQADRAVLHVLQGRTYAAAGNYAAAIAALEQAYSITRNKEIAFLQLNWAKEAGFVDKVPIYSEKTRHATTGNPRHDAMIDRQLSP